MHVLLLTIVSLLMLISDASAYVGPGLGLGAIGAVFASVFAIFLAFIGIVWYPFKRLIKKFRSSKDLQEESN